MPTHSSTAKVASYAISGADLGYAANAMPCGHCAMCGTGWRKEFVPGAELVLARARVHIGRGLGVCAAKRQEFVMEHLTSILCSVIEEMESHDIQVSQPWADANRGA
eukprot:3044731-Rhodomonas_salina.2